MKNVIFTLIAVLLLSSGGLLSAQTHLIDLGIFKKASKQNQLEIRLRPSQNIVNGIYSAGIFTVRIPSVYGLTLSDVPGSSPYNYAIMTRIVGHLDGYDYYPIQFSGGVYKVNWEKGKEYPIIALQVNGGAIPNAGIDLVTNTKWTDENNTMFYQELNLTSAEKGFYKQPIKTTSFTATALPSRSVQLDWEYESETELAYSEVEYCVDGLGFGFIGTAPANNSGDRAAGYSFLHNTPQSNVNYYRIRMVDINGDVEYSSVRAINFDDLNADFSVFPNPSAGPITLVSRNLSKYGTGVRFQIMDNSGKVVRSGNVVDDNENFDLSKMAAGVYNLQVLTDKEQLEKFQIVIAN